MFRILSLCICCLCSTLLYSTAGADTAPAPLEPVDKIVAVVNDDVITSTELDTRLHSIKEQLKNQSSPMPARCGAEKAGIGSDDPRQPATAIGRSKRHPRG